MQLVFYWAPKLARKCERKHWFPVVRTDGRAYGHVITKFSRMGRLPHFLSYGAPSTRARFARGWSSAIRSENRKRPALLVRMYKVLKLLSVTAGEKVLLRTVSRFCFSSNRFSSFDFHILTLNMSISSAVRPLSLRA